MDQDRDFSIREFRDQFLKKIGFVEGNDPEPVQLLYAIGSWYSHIETLLKYGVRPGEQAFLVEWVPAGLKIIFDENSKEKPIRAEFVEPEAIAAREKWVNFPAVFRDKSVYYRKYYLNGVPELSE